MAIHTEEELKMGDWKRLLLHEDPSLAYLVPLVEEYGAPTRDECKARLESATGEHRRAISELRMRLLEDEHREWKKINQAVANFKDEDPDGAARVWSFVRAISFVRGGTGT